MPQPRKITEADDTRLNDLRRMNFGELAHAEIHEYLNLAKLVADNLRFRRSFSAHV